jgi:hypothetical protein
LMVNCLAFVFPSFYNHQVHLNTKRPDY